MTITLTDIEGFKNYLIEEEKSEATLEKYLRDVRVFREHLGEANVDKRIVLAYKEKLSGEYAPASVNSVLSSLNSFFDYLGCSELKVKTLKIQKQIFARRDRELTKEEYERLLRAAKSERNQRLYYLMQTICSCGIRVSELRFVTVEALRYGQANINCKGKMRVVIIPRELCKALSKYAKQMHIESGSIFVTRTGKALDRSSIWKMMKSLCESAGVAKDKVFPHNLRHLFARTYYSIEKDIVRLADILGHTSINTTRIYTMETGDIHRMQIQRLGLLRL